MRTRYPSLLLVLALICAGCAATTPSRNGTARVQWINDGGFAVHVTGSPGSTASAMGRRATLEACKATRDRGGAYYTVQEFTMSGGVQEVQTQEEGVSLVLNSTGQAVGAVNRPAEYETSSYGRALLMGVIIGPESLELFGRSMQIMDANTCVVYSRPN